MATAHEEARTLTRGAVVLLMISVVRFGGEVVHRLTPHGDPDVVSVADTLAARTAAAITEEGRRSMPLSEGETVDPNLADESRLDRLPGVGPATAAAIASARDSGAVFRRPEDLLEVRGVGPASLRRLRPHLAFGAGEAARGPGASHRTPTVRRRPVESGGGGGGTASGPIDVNSAGPDVLQSLPGVGPALAARIVEERARERFTDVDDLVRVRGIGPSTVERLRGLAIARRRR